MTEKGTMMTQRRIEQRKPYGRRATDIDPDERVLARLVAELGRAAQAGWGPTARWLAFLLVLGCALAILDVLSH